MKVYVGFCKQNLLKFIVLTVSLVCWLFLSFFFFFSTLL